MLDIHDATGAVFLVDRSHPGSHLDLFGVHAAEKMRDAGIRTIEFHEGIAVGCRSLNAGAGVYKTKLDYGTHIDFTFVGHGNKIIQCHIALSAQGSGRHIYHAALGALDPDDPLVVSQLLEKFRPVLSHAPLEWLTCLPGRYG